MKYRLCLAGALVSALLSSSALAAPAVTTDGAAALEANLTTYFPQDLLDAHVLRVQTAGDHYELIGDLQALFNYIHPEDVTVHGLSPLIYRLVPKDDGTFALSLNQDLNVNGAFGKDKARTDFQYRIGSIDYSALFDPALHVLTSGHSSLKDGLFEVTGPEQSIRYKIEAANNEVTAKAGRAAGLIDMSVTGISSGIDEEIKQANAAPVHLTLDKINTVASIEGVRQKPLSEIIVILLRAWKTDKLEDADQERLKSLAREASPFLDHFSEDVRLGSMVVTTPLGPFTLSSTGFGMDLANTEANTSFSFGMSFGSADISAIPPVAAYQDLLPKHSDVKMSIPNLYLAHAVDLALRDDQGGAKGPSNPKADGERFAKELFGTGPFRVLVDSLNLDSDHYAFSMTGDITLQSIESKKGTVHALIKADHFDDTIEWAKGIGKVDPKLGQAAFFMMMAKGMSAKGEPGQAVWDVVVAEDETVTINGNVVVKGGK